MLVKSFWSSAPDADSTHSDHGMTEIRAQTAAIRALTEQLDQLSERRIAVVIVPQLVEELTQLGFRILETAAEVSKTAADGESVGEPAPTRIVRLAPWDEDAP